MQYVHIEIEMLKNGIQIAELVTENLLIKPYCNIIFSQTIDHNHTEGEGL